MDTPSLEDHKKSFFLKHGVPFRNRRRGVSEIARAERSLERAVAYLVVLQNQNPERDYQEAIVILCRAVGQMAATERRKPARDSILNRLKRLRTSTLKE